MAQWVRLDVDIFQHPQVISLSMDAKLGYLQMICLAQKFGTDGYISPEHFSLAFLQVFAQKSAQKELISSGLLEPVLNGGWNIRNFLKWNPSAAELAERHQKRADAGQLGGLAKARNESSKRSSNARSDARAMLYNVTLRNGNTSTTEVLDSISIQGGPGGEKTATGDIDQRALEVLGIFGLPQTPNNIKACDRRLQKYGALLPEADLVGLALDCHQYHVNLNHTIKNWFGAWDTWLRKAVEYSSKQAPKSNGSGPSTEDIAQSATTGIPLWDELKPYIRWLSRTGGLPQRRNQDPTYHRFAAVQQQGNILLLHAENVIEHDLEEWSRTIPTIAQEHLHKEVQVRWV